MLAMTYALSILLFRLRPSTRRAMREIQRVGDEIFNGTNNEEACLIPWVNAQST
jgi:hypothetical protein